MHDATTEDVDDGLDPPDAPDAPDEPDAPDAPDSSQEPRGPHLPGTLARVPALAWIFILLGVLRLIWFLRESDLGPAPELSSIVAFISALTPSVVAVLLPAALLVRHPDAPSRSQTLFLGTVLFAVVEGLRVLSTPLQPLFEQLTPGSEETPFLVPLALLYSAAAGLLGAFAIANVALGLGQARRYDDRSGTRLIRLAVVLIVVLVALARVLAVSRLPFDQIPMTATVIVYLASTVILGILSIAAWGYLAATSLTGARAGESPGSGWIVGAIGASLVVSAFTLSAVLGLARPSAEEQPFFTSLGQLTSGIFALGYLGLLGGLLLGMPSLDELDELDASDDDVDWDPDLDDDDDFEPIEARPSPGESPVELAGQVDN